MIGQAASKLRRLASAGFSRHRAALLVLVLVTVTAGCAGSIGSDSPDDSAPLDSVPAEADGLVHVQTAVLTDSVTESVMDDLMEMETAEDIDADPDTPGSWEEVLEEVEDETGIDIDDVQSVTMFVGDEVIDDEEYAGLVVQSDLTWDDLVEAADEEFDDDLEETTYNGVTVYADDDELDDDGWVADFGDGTYALGPRPVVEDVIDTREGDAPGIDDDLRDTYEDATEGYLTAAFTLTEEQTDLAEDVATEEAGIGEMFVPEAEALSMSYYTEDGQLTAEMDVVMRTTEDAETFAGVAEPIVEPPSAPENPDPEEQPLEWFVDGFSIDSDDERVSLVFSADPDELRQSLEALEESDPLAEEFALGASVAAAAA